jgi:hypothetical protein
MSKRQSCDVEGVESIREIVSYDGLWIKCAMSQECGIVQLRAGRVRRAKVRGGREIRPLPYDGVKDV